MNDIWGFIAKADKKRQLIGDIRYKEQKIRELPNVCGSCNLWMTNQCRREKKIRVSDGMLICVYFQQQKWVTDLISKMEIEVVKLQNDLNNLNNQIN